VARADAWQARQPRSAQRQALPWRTAAEIIDWSIPCPSIFERKKPLAEATCRRIARGIVRYVLENPKPFIVRTTQATTWPQRRPSTSPLRRSRRRQPELRRHAAHHEVPRRRTGHPIDEPLATVTANSFIKRPGGSGPV
jgi:DNA (cytosine-5)-methyltransferase 1